MPSSVRMPDTSVIAWACLGLAAALVGCVWPFRRGVAGIAINVFAGVIGAVCGGFAFEVVSHGRGAPINLMGAAIGALVGLWVVHWIWQRWRSMSSSSRAFASRPATGPPNGEVQRPR